MRLHLGCACCGGVSRRTMLQGAFAAAAVGAMATPARAQLASASRAAGVRPIDIHAHYFPQSYLDVIVADGKRFNAELIKGDDSFSLKTPGGSPSGLTLQMVDIDRRLADMDAQGVAVHALSLTMPMVYWGDADMSQALARAWNDGAIAAHKAHPDRFVVLAALPMQYPDRAIDELDRVARIAGVRGVYMGTNIGGRDLDDPLFAAIFARIEALDLPIFLHPLQPIGGSRLGAYFLQNFIGFPVDTAIAASRLIFGGVLDRHPRLEINLPHAGGVLPILIGRMDHGWQVRPEAKKIAQAPSSYLRRFTYDTIAHSKPIMEFVISQVGADRIMLGSDYCYDVGYDQPLEFLDQIALSPEQRKMILGGTAARILKLAASAPT